MESMTSDETEVQYFHCYATANDRVFYLEDFINLLSIKSNFSGVDRLTLYIAISKVKNMNFIDRIFVFLVKKIFRNHPTVRLESIFFKENIGRDFSSYSLLYKKLEEKASVNDFVFFQNRSASGPYKKKWIEDFVHQYRKFNNIALCGSTISFKDHPKRSKKTNLPHVQTYAFLTKVKFLKMFNNEFPAENETDRLKIITNGEIALSQFFLNKGFDITSMEWSDNAINNNTIPISNNDCKNDVVYNHQFYHRRYFKKHKLLKIKKIMGLIFAKMDKNTFF